MFVKLQFVLIQMGGSFNVATVINEGSTMFIAHNTQLIVSFWCLAFQAVIL